MSTAFDLTAPVSVPEIEEEAANGPGPRVSWEPQSGCAGAGHDACDPPEHAASASADLPRCTGFGDVRASGEITAELPSGEPYPGDLVADILEYRRLRTHALGGGRLPEHQEDRHEELHTRLRAQESERIGHGRAYLRFDLRVPATLRVPEGRGVRASQVAVDNISAGGVKLMGAKARAEGERVELLMETGDGRTVVLPARVAWMHGQAVGLMFAGAARWR